MRSNIQHACATYLVLHGVNRLQVLTLLFGHKGLLSTKPSLLSAGVPYTPALFFPYSLRSFPEARLSETGFPGISLLVLQPQLAMEGSSSAAVVTAFGPHLVTSSPARPV